MVFTETVDDPTAEVAVVRERRPGQFDWEFISASPYRASHRFHSLNECPNLDYCQQRPYDVGSYM